MKRTLIEALGWYGIVAVVTAYALTSFSLISNNSFAYQLLNLTGALGIVFVSLQKKAYQPGILNIIWAIIAFAAIVKLIFLR